MAEMKQDDGVIVNDDSIYGKKIVPTVAPDRKQDIDLDNTLYDNIIGAGMSSQLDITELNSLNQTAENRNQMYNIFDTMCEDGSISAVLETYAEDATERNDSGKIVWVQSSDSKVAQYVEFLLDTLNVDKNIYKWVHSLCKYGDLYLRLYRQSDYEDELFVRKEPKTLTEGASHQLEEDVKIKAYSKNDNYVHYMEMAKNPAEMFELTKFGKTVGYVKAPVNSTIMKQDNTSFNTFKYKFKKGDVTLFPATEFVHASLEGNTSREEETVNIFLTESDYNNDENAHTYSVKKGESLLSNVHKVWRELNLLELSVLLNRITKSSIIRLINIEVGDMPKENVPKTLMKVKSMIEQKIALKQGGAMGEYTNPGPVENNVYVPTHGGVGAITTSQIGGDVDVKSLADLDYYMNKLYGQLRVPKQYFSQTDDSAGFNGGSSLAIISSRYAKMIKRIQNAILQALTDAINLMCLDKQLDAYVNNFTLHMLPPTTQEEIDRRESMSNKVALSNDIMSMLTDIEDPITKLKILKSLLSKVIDDNEIVQLLQDEIERLEQEQEATESEDGGDLSDDEFGMGDDSSEVGGGMSDMSGDMSGDMAGDMDMGGDDTSSDMGDMEADSEPQSMNDTALPNGNDLGVDLTDTE